MNRILLITLSFLTSYLSFGQFIQSRIVGEQLLDETLDHALIGTANKRLLSISEQKDVFYIDIYDTDSLKLLYHEQLQLLKTDDYELEIQGIYRIGDQFNLVASGFSASLKQFGVFIYPVTEEGKLISSFQEIHFPGRSKTAVTVSHDIRVNSDKSQLLVHLTFLDKYHDLADHHLFVYNDKLVNVFRTAREGFPFSTSKQKHALAYFIGKKHLYELNQETVYNSSLKRYQAELTLKKMDFEGVENVFVGKVKLADGFLLSDIRFKENSDGIELFATYLASYKKTFSGIRGVYVAKFNSDLSLNFSKENVFSKATKAKSLKGYENAEELDVPVLYTLNNHFTDSKGNTYLLYERESQTSSGGLTEFYYGSVIAVKVTPDGNVEWDAFIPKSQFFKERGMPLLIVLPGLVVATPFAIRFSKDSRQYLSFKPLMKDDELYLIYNDNPQNEGKTAVQGRENMTNVNQSVPFAVHLSSTGTIDYQILKNLKLDTENQRIIYSVTEGTTWYTLRDSGKKETLQRIEFEW